MDRAPELERQADHLNFALFAAAINVATAATDTPS